MHKVCDIRNPNLRAGLSPQEVWVAHRRDLERLFDLALGVGDPARVIELPQADRDPAKESDRRAA
jgi:hypothetical protein